MSCFQAAELGTITGSGTAKTEKRATKKAIRDIYKNGDIYCSQGAGGCAAGSRCEFVMTSATFDIAYDADDNGGRFTVTASAGGTCECL